MVRWFVQYQVGPAAERPARYVTQMATTFAKTLIVISICNFGLAQASDDALFNIDSDRIREIALEAAVEKYPEIQLEILSESPHGDHFVIWCQSAFKLGYVSKIEEDFDYCFASVRFKVAGTRNTREYLGEDGFCYSETKTDSFKVEVSATGNTDVSPIGSGSGRARIECTEDLEGWRQ